MSGTVNVATARNNLSQLLNRVAYGGETIIIESRGKPKAALVGADRVTGEPAHPSIVITSGVRSGKPHLAGRRITVADIAIWHVKMGCLPDQIAADYDLSLAEVHAALSYYYAHQDIIDAEIDEAHRFAESLRQQASSPLPDKLAADD